MICWSRPATNREMLIATLPFRDPQDGTKYLFGQTTAANRLVCSGEEAHLRLVPQRSPLDDPRNSAHAFRRFRKLMKLMMAVTAAVVLIAMVLLYLSNGVASIHMYIATALGVGFAMLLTGALMGLVFLSSGSGHDESVKDARSRDDDQPDGRSR